MKKFSAKVFIGLLAFIIGVIVFAAFNFFCIAEKANIIQETDNKASEQIGQGSASGNVLVTLNKLENSDDNISKIYDPSCTDKELLPLWNELKKDSEFKEKSKEFYQQADCTDLVNIEKIDLNNDGELESVVWGNPGYSANLCGGTGNCVVWIYEKKHGNYKQILQSYAYKYDESEKWFEVKKIKTNGYQNLLLKGHATGYETTEHYYEFDGKQYREKKCLFISYHPNPKGDVMTCEEAWKR